MLAEEALEMRAFRFADDLAGVVLGETVDHHPVVTEHGLQIARRLPRHLLDGRQRLRAADQQAGEIERAAAQRRGVLELEYGVAGVAMRGHVEYGAVLD